MHNDRAIEADHFVRARGANGLDEFVVSLAHVAPPSVLDIAFEFDTERSVVPEAVNPTVDLTGLKHESTSLAERHQFFHLHIECVSRETEEVGSLKFEVGSLKFN